MCPWDCWAAPGHPRFHLPPFFLETQNGLVLLWCYKLLLHRNVSAQFFLLNSLYLTWALKAFFPSLSWTASLNLHVRQQVDMQWFVFGHWGTAKQTRNPTLSDSGAGRGKHKSIILQRENKAQVSIKFNRRCVGWSNSGRSLPPAHSNTWMGFAGRHISKKVPVDTDAISNIYLG